MSDISKEYVQKVCIAAPFADNEAGIPQMVVLIKALAAEVDRCHSRLEIDHEFDGDMNRVEIPMNERMNQVDGISCRDETIRQYAERPPFDTPTVASPAPKETL